MTCSLTSLSSEYTGDGSRALRISWRSCLTFVLLCGNLVEWCAASDTGNKIAQTRDLFVGEGSSMPTFKFKETKMDEMLRKLMV